MTAPTPAASSPIPQAGEAAGSAVEPQYLACPFCGEADFDLPGLKGHLLYGGCDPYEGLIPWQDVSDDFMDEDPAARRAFAAEGPARTGVAS